jgi:SAM-dependent methyltransferase
VKVLDTLKRIPVDLGQAHLKHRTEGKLIAIRHIPPADPRARALDVGCRDGHYSELLKQRGYRVDSIDLHPQYAPARTVDADRTLPWDDSTFDLVWSSEVIEHLKDVDFSLAEFRRVLKPGGLLILTTPNSGCWIYHALSLVGIPPRRAQNPDHKHFFTDADIRRLFPGGRVFGYFPYLFAKFTIRRWFFLSPTFVIVENRANGAPRR